MPDCGVAYYPEAWPREQWETDVRLMREAGLTLVRMGEFAWARLEPSEGRFDIAWLREVCERFAKAGVRVLAATPSAAPPPWFAAAHPEALAVNADGRRLTAEGRRYTCPSSPPYRQTVIRVVRQLAEALRDQPNLLGWQIDNELAPYDEGCHCPRCAEAFREWLQRRYGTLAHLNDAWGNVFWSGDYSAWSEIEPPRLRLARRLDFRRFQDELIATLIRDQADVLRDVNPRWLLTTNQWAGLNPGADVTRYFAPLDRAGLDCYWEYYADRAYFSAMLDFYRNVRGKSQPFWVTETNAWNPNTIATHGLAALRPWAYAALARGAETHIYFRWRQSRMGEEDHPAVLDWSGQPGRPYRQIQAVAQEWRRLAPVLDALPPPSADVAIVSDYDSALCGVMGGYGGWQRLAATHAALNRLGVMADVIPMGADVDWERYRLVILPQIELVDAEGAARFIRLAQRGGVLLAQTRLATRDRCGKYLGEALPAGLTELFGMRVEERHPIRRGGVKRVQTAPAPADGVVPDRVAVCWQEADAPPMCGTAYMECLAPSSATTLARYEEGAFAGSAAVTGQPFGRGHVFYQGCWLDEAGTDHLLAAVLRQAGVPAFPKTPPEVEILQRGRLRFYLNHGPDPQQVPLRAPGEVLLGVVHDGAFMLGGFDVGLMLEAPSAPA